MRVPCHERGSSTHVYEPAFFRRLSDDGVMPEKLNERVARHLVARALGVSVSRHEDGTKDSQVDAMIHGADGLEALEIIADHEAGFNAQWAALERLNHRLEVPGLRRDWSVQLVRSARVKDIAKYLPALMLALQDEQVPSGPERPRAVSNDMARLGVQVLYPLSGAGSGRVHLRAQGWGSPAASKTMARFVEQVLDAAPDVPHKLSQDSAPRKHAFIWTTIGTDYGIQSGLERREQPLPLESPVLPSGVTHVWVAGSFGTQGALVWFPERGWWRPEYPWSEGEPSSLVENVEGVASPGDG